MDHIDHFLEQFAADDWETLVSDRTRLLDG
jgi:hypothetical protein